MSVPFNGRIALVVEDDWFVRADIANQFRREGWMVLEAATGAKALELLREGQSIDILVTDIVLADAITGWDVAEAARRVNPEVPVIYASGGTENDGRRVLDSVSLTKPMTAHDLLLACSKLLSTGAVAGRFRLGLSKQLYQNTESPPTFDAARRTQTG